ncbi:hypothetical protein BU15DRAFT_69717 [Melanogaster broomeanus]|nr:hypothetical protein BU15DRAFT_69717 [Melanogaster broomeanus]
MAGVRREMNVRGGGTKVATGVDEVLVKPSEESGVEQEDECDGNRYSAILDPVIDGELRATQHDVLESYRPCIKKSALFLNAGVTPEEAEALIAQNKIDAAVFGMLWISHPDLAKRLEHGKPLDNQIEFTKLYGLGPEMTLEELKKGYTDYPAYHATQEKL